MFAISYVVRCFCQRKSVSLSVCSFDETYLSYLRSLTGRNDIPQATACIMQYTGYTSVSPYDAPTYANCGTSDGIALWTVMQNRLQQLQNLGISTEFHSYSGLPYGFGLGTGTIAEGWIEDAIKFWKSNSHSAGIDEVIDTNIDNESVYSIDGVKHRKPVKGINITGNKKIWIK